MANGKRLIDVDVAEKSIRTSVPLLRANIGCGYGEGAADALSSVADILKAMPTVDAVEVADMREFAEDVVYQFGCYCQKGGRLCITHGGLSTLEWAFDILGWENPHPVPECECEIEGCHEHATCGTPTADGYKRMCGKHYRNHCAKMDGGK